MLFFNIIFFYLFYKYAIRKKNENRTLRVDKDLKIQKTQNKRARKNTPSIFCFSRSLIRVTQLLLANNTLYARGKPNNMFVGGKINISDYTGVCLVGISASVSRTKCIGLGWVKFVFSPIREQRFRPNPRPTRCTVMAYQYENKNGSRFRAKCMECFNVNKNN